MDADTHYKLSAIVLVYNGEKYLNDCLDSLVEQTLDSLEIILVNDASTDDSLSICREYAANFSNIKIINKTVNEGLAITGNTGIEAANGEYIILVDNDDIIPPYAYEKLYNKAKENNSDIVTGKANFLIGDYQYEMHDYENSVWKQECTIKSAKDFSTLFHDAFYWNKIIRRALIVDNDIKLPKDMIYADRKFVHTCFIHADTISIIPDCVYLWRQRSSESDTSLSMKRREAWNYINRIDSYEQDLDDFTLFDENYFKILMRRVLVPIMGILESEEFKEVFFERAYKILSNEAKKYEDIYDNDLDILLNLYIYLILHDYKDDLVKLLKSDIDGQTNIIFENGKNYWNLPCFRHSRLKIPDRLFEIDSLTRSFVNFNDLIIEDKQITFNTIEIPKNFPIKKGEVVFVGRTTYEDVLEDNKLSFPLKPVDGDDVPNKFNAKIPTDLLRSVEIYDVMLQFEYPNGKSNKFRISKHSFNNIINKSEYAYGYLTVNNNLSINTLMINDAFTIEPTDDSLNFVVNENIVIKDPLELFIQNRRSNEIVYFTPIKNMMYQLEWEYFLDKGSVYDFKLRFKEKSSFMKRSFLSNFNDISFKHENVNIKIYTTKNGRISLKS
jgi:glycosyltransferase involved in cell wall biosynthesis